MRNHFPRHRHQLPQLDGQLFLSDGGLETTLIFHEGWELPMFAAFPLLESDRGTAALRDYFDRYIPLAARSGTGFILEAPTWRANPDWGSKLSYDMERLAAVNRLAVALLQNIAAANESEQMPMVVSGCIGPRGDGYDPGNVMRAEDAQAYHAWQIGVFKDAGVDLVSAFTLTNINEAVGIAAAAKAADMPCALSFTLETDGKLPTGETLREAITVVDMETGASPVYYMIARIRRISANRCRTLRIGCHGSAACVRTHRNAVTQSSTMRRISISAIPRGSASNTRRCAVAFRTLQSWADAAGPTTAICTPSRKRAVARLQKAPPLGGGDATPAG